LEYCIQLWSPSLKADIKLIEGVQKRALKLIKGYTNVNYPDRLKNTGLISLEKRRIRGDLIQMFKMSKNLHVFQTIFTLNNSNSLRGNKFKIFKPNCRLNLKKNFFSHRTVNIWNRLPNSIACSDSINLFKNKLDVFNYFTEEN
jgi:hypothetical protein